MHKCIKKIQFSNVDSKKIIPPLPNPPGKISESSTNANVVKKITILFPI